MKVNTRAVVNKGRMAEVTTVISHGGDPAMVRLHFALDSEFGPDAGKHVGCEMTAGEARMLAAMLEGCADRLDPQPATAEEAT